MRILWLKKNTTPGIFTEPKERLMVEQTKTKEKRNDRKRNGKFPKEKFQSLSKQPPIVSWRFLIKLRAPSSSKTSNLIWVTALQTKTFDHSLYLVSILFRIWRVRWFIISFSRTILFKIMFDYYLEIKKKQISITSCFKIFALIFFIKYNSIYEYGSFCSLKKITFCLKICFLF